MPGLCPHLLGSLKDPSGPGKGGTLAPGAESGWGWGWGWGWGRAEEDHQLHGTAPSGYSQSLEGGGLAVQQSLIKEFPVCFFNSVFSGI